MAKKAKTGANGESGPSKMQMVREALEELGSDAKPKDIGEAIRKKHGTTVNPQMISAYKSTINSGGAAGRSRSGRSSAGNVSVDDVETIRGLVSRIGAEGLTKLVKVLS